MFEFQFIKFLIAGAIGAAANVGSRFIFSEFFRFEIAIVLAYFVGMSIAFIIMKIFVFNIQSNINITYIIKFSVVNCLAIAQTYLISIFFAYWLLPYLGVIDSTELYGHIVGVLFPVLTSYIGHKYFTFSKKNEL